MSLFTSDTLTQVHQRRSLLWDFVLQFASSLSDPLTFERRTHPQHRLTDRVIANHFFHGRVGVEGAP